MNIITVKNILLASVVLMCLVNSAHADIYQYVDNNGVVHFTNVPSSSTKKAVKVHPDKNRSTFQQATAPRTTGNKNKANSSNTIPVSYANIINSACSRFGVDPSLVHAIVKVESDFNPYAISRKGAMGLMQLMPQTADTMNVRNTFNPDENVEGGVKYLRYLLDRYEGNISLSLAAYNAGETAVKKWGTIPPYKETQEYVKKVLQIYNGTGSTFSPRYTIYVGSDADGTILLTDNPSNHPEKKLRRKMGQSL